MRKHQISSKALLSMLAVLLFVAFAFSFEGTAVAQASKSTAAKNIVVVDGAFADGSGWEGVHGILTKDGYTVTIVQNPLISLDGDVAATNGQLPLFSKRAESLVLLRRFPRSRLDDRSDRLWLRHMHG